MLAVGLTTLFSARQSKKKERSSSEFASLKSVFDKWDGSLGLNCPEFKNFDQILKKHPELTTQYLGKIGQKLLNANLPEEAKFFVENVLKKESTPEASIFHSKYPYYVLYSQTSLTISEGKFQQALKEATDLKESMEKDKSFWEKSYANDAAGGTLFAFNLARIAMLFGDLHDKINEKKAWDVLMNYLEVTDNSTPQDIAIHKGVNRFISHLTVQECSIVDYLNSR